MFFLHLTEILTIFGFELWWIHVPTYICKNHLIWRRGPQKKFISSENGKSKFCKITITSLISVEKENSICTHYQRPKPLMPSIYCRILILRKYKHHDHSFVCWVSSVRCHISVNNIYWRHLFSRVLDTWKKNICFRQFLLHIITRTFL